MYHYQGSNAFNIYKQYMPVLAFKLRFPKPVSNFEKEL